MIQTTSYLEFLMNNPFDNRSCEECDEKFRELVGMIENLRQSDRADDINFCRELDSGKMLGVLIAEDNQGTRHTLYAFSGQLGSGGFNREGFVEPVFDYLRPDGHFKRNEKEISQLNREIAMLEQGDLIRVKTDYERQKGQIEKEVSAFREKCRLSKAERAVRRKAPDVTADEQERMIRQSQFEKAELRRLKARLNDTLEPYALRYKTLQTHIESLKEERRLRSERLQDWLFTNFRVLNGRGEWRSLKEIFADTPFKIPPSGAGECCGPKLIQAAYRRGLRPVRMSEYWYGAAKGGELRIHGCHYAACRGKCLPILTWMLEGLDVTPPLSLENHCETHEMPEIIYENEWFCVVSKPSGMCSVSGKTQALSLEEWLSHHYGADRNVKVAHRLDRDTSGVMIATFGADAYRIMQSLFATRKVEKKYIAELEGDYREKGLPEEGRIEIPLSADILDRPRQRVDHEEGKEAVTDYKFISVSHGRSLVEFYPHTGRTHQLRVHSAADEGLRMPIVGDLLYGIKSDKEERLHLHAQSIRFTFPIDGKEYSFTKKSVIWQGEY